MGKTYKEAHNPAKNPSSYKRKTAYKKPKLKPYHRTKTIEYYEQSNKKKT